MATGEDKQFGPIRKVPYAAVFNDVSLSFICDVDMIAKKTLDAWQHTIVNYNMLDAGRTFMCEYYEEYTGSMSIQTLSETAPQKVLYEVSLAECYPIEVVPVQLANDNNDSYMKVEARFAYRYWTTVS